MNSGGENNKLFKLNFQEEEYDTRFPNKLIDFPNSFSTMALKGVVCEEFVAFINNEF